MVDLQWTMDAVLGRVGPEPGPVADGVERSGAGEYRDLSLPFVARLFSAASAHAEATPLDEAELAACEADGVEPGSCLDSWIRDRGLRLYRRPLTDEQVAGYLTHFSEHSRTSSAAIAARSVLMSMLLSPYFVFRIELGADNATALEAPPPIGAPPALPNPTLPPGSLLSSFEVAARLSHFATRSAPDPMLLASAATGGLNRPEELLEQLERLQATPEGRRARALQHLEWLRIENFSAADVDGDADLAQDMLQQTSLFISDVLEQRGGTLTELLTSSRQPLSARLVEHYGMELPVSGDWELLDLKADLYSGVLGQGALLARYRSPTYRGLFVLEQLLCREMPAPPALPPDLPMGGTPRERIASVTNQPQCVGCHVMMDPQGFALEAFDPLGRLTGYDTSGALRLPSSGEVLLQGPTELGRAIAHSPEGKACAVQRYVEHLLDRKLGEGLDALWIDCFMRDYHGEDLDLDRLARQLVVSDALLRMTRAPSVVVGVSDASDPIDHAREETAGLLGGFGPDDGGPQLEQYMDALRHLQLSQP